MNERGNMTILAAGIAAALTTILLVVLSVSAVVTDKHRAQVAADMAAIAGAHAAFMTGESCAVASEVAAKNNAYLLDCALDGLDVQVTVKIRAASAKARAGPVDEVSADE